MKKQPSSSSSSIEIGAAPDFEASVDVVEAGRCSTWWKSINWLGLINRYRLGVQWFTALALSTLFLFLPAVHDFFDGLEIFIPLGAVSLFDPTIGGHVRKLLDRVSGVLGALFAAAVVLLPLGLSGLDSMVQYPWLKWVMYSQAILVAFFWGYWHEIYPRHVSLQYVGITSSMSIYIMTSDKFLGSMWRVTVANLCGVSIGALVFRYVLPKRARLLIRADLVQALDKLSLTLQPLVELESGMVKSPSFFRRKIPKSGSYLHRMMTGRMGSTVGSIRHADSSLRGSLRNSQSSAGSVAYEDFREFRTELWQRIEAVHTLLSAQDPLLRPAEREYSRRPPHKFPTTHYKEFLHRSRRLFYHTVSLYVVIETQDAFASTAFPEHAQKVLGDQLAWAGAVRISRQQEDDAVTSSIKKHFAEPEQSTPLRLSVVTHEEEPERLAGLPLLKWAGVYSPLIGRVSRHSAACIAKLSIGLQHLKMNEDIHKELQAAEQAMHQLSEERRQWQGLVRKMYNILLVDSHNAELYASTMTEVEKTILRRLMGIQLEEYIKLDQTQKRRLWSSFGSCVDRLAVTSRTLLALVVELAACVSALESLLNHLRP